jgi:predicted ATPase
LFTGCPWGSYCGAGPSPRRGRPKKVFEKCKWGLAALRGTQARFALPYFLTLLADTYGKQGSFEAGLEALDEAQSSLHRNGDFCEAEVYRQKGELLFMQGGSDGQAEACFHTAVDIARRQKAKSLELRAVTGLSRLWCRKEKTKQARKALEEVYCWFNEGHDTADLRAARSLLEALSWEDKKLTRGF